MARPGVAAAVRYAQTVVTAGKTLREHIERVHDDFVSDVSLILKVHEAMLTDWGFHNGVRERVAKDRRNAEWALKGEGKRVIEQFVANGSGTPWRKKLLKRRIFHPFDEDLVELSL